MSEERNIKSQIEERLIKQQISKEFKDIGRVANTKKEKSAYRLISSSILGKLEEDSVMAYNMVKKDNVWQPIDVSLEKERGVSSGATYLKVKIREALPTRPKDDKQKRASYVLFVELLQKDLFNCYNVEQIKLLFEAYKNLPIDQVIGFFVNSEFLTASVERQEELKKLIQTEPKYRMFRIYSGYSLTRKLINEIFGSRFENILFRGSDSANDTYREAIKKEPVSQEEADKLVNSLKEKKERFKEANLEKIDSLRNMSDSELIRNMHTNWNINPINQKRYKANPNEFKEWAIAYYESTIERGLLSRDAEIKNTIAKENDWSWFEQPKEKSQSVKEKVESINTKTPLSYIKRTGGYKIENISPKEIIEQFGFNAVNYGVYVDDTWSKEHTKHFLGAMSDLGEILNINLNQINNLGKLSIAFGAKGTPGHLATYFPQSKDINLTKGNGDGSLAHEWGHYFDNVIVELDKKVATNSFASQGLIDDLEIKALFEEFKNFYINGNDNYTPLLPITFYPKEIADAPKYMKRNAIGLWENVTVEILPTIEETLENVKDLMKISNNLYRNQIRVFGYILNQFGLKEYDIKMKLPTSYYYHKSYYKNFIYCDYNDKNQEVITVSTRTKYWTESVELFARAWETIVLKKLHDANRESNYLVADIPMNDVISENYFSPYPQGLELEYLESLFDRIIIAVKNKFNIGSFVPPSNIREDIYLDLSTNQKTGKTENGMVVENKKDETEQVVFIKDDKVINVIPQIDLNPYIGKTLEFASLEAYKIGQSDALKGSSNNPNNSIELQKILEAGYAKNVIENSWISGYNKEKYLLIDKSFEERFSETPPKEENITTIIEGLELLSESMDGNEKTEIMEIIEGLKLLV